MTTPATRLHHVGVQTFDVANSLSWYQDFFGCAATWSTDRFSELTRSRLPGVTRLVEVELGGIRLHLFERAGVEHPHAKDEVQFQHLCVAVGSADELPVWRTKWLTLYHSGRYRFLLGTRPTEIVIDDDDGVRSFYCLDVNGLEFEFTHVPEATQ